MNLTSMRIVSILIVIFIVIIKGDEKIEKNHASFYPLSDNEDPLVDEDLEKGLHSLSTKELEALSEFIDKDESAAYDDQNDAEMPKKKRTIDDLYDEMAHENAEVEYRRNYQKDQLIDDGRCRCAQNLRKQKEDAIRTKRDNLNGKNEEESFVDKYFRQLEQSFPQDHLATIDDDDLTIEKNDHVRIKRL